MMNEETEESMPSRSAELSLLVKCRIHELTDAAALVGSAAKIESTAISRLRDHVLSIVRDCATGVTVDSVLEINLSEDLLVQQLTDDLEDVTGVPAERIRDWLATVGIDVEPESEAEVATAPYVYPCGLQAGDRLLFRPHVRTYVLDRMATVVPGLCGGHSVQCEDADGVLHIIQLSLVAEARRGDKLLRKTGKHNDVLFHEPEDN